MGGRRTLREVAAAASVSLGTASMALAGDRRVAARTRAVVAAAAAELGYRPDPALASLASRHFQHAGKPVLVASWMDHDDFHGMLRSAADALGMAVRAIGQEVAQAELPGAISRLGATAVVIHRRLVDVEGLARLGTHAILWLDEGLSPPYPCDIVETDEWWTTTRGALAKLAAAGYAAPAVVLRPATPRHWQDDVRAAAARSAGAAVLEWDRTPASLLRFLRRSRPDALLLGTVAVHTAVRRARLDLPSYVLMVPPHRSFAALTGWRQDHEGRCRATLELVEQRLRHGERSHRRIIIPPCWQAGRPPA